MKFPQITHVAIKQNGKIFCLPSPYRHHHIIKMLVIVCELEKPITGKQGFMSDAGDFLTREEAAELALINGQVKKLIAPPKLYSEDLW